MGSVVSLVGRARERALKMGLPTDGVCADRFAKQYSRGHLDICIPQRHMGLTNGERLTWAFAWGRVVGQAVFRLPDGVIATGRQ